MHYRPSHSVIKGERRRVVVLKMSKKLIYFDLKGLGEPLRYILHYGGIQFEDVRIPYSEWSTKKNEVSFPFGRLPVFIDGDRTLNQSMAIARYIGRGLNLVPTDPWEEASVDAVILTFIDLLNSTSPVFREQDAKKKEAIKKELIEETFPFYFTRFENIIKENNGHIGKKLTWADFLFVGFLESTEEFVQVNIQDKYSAVKELVNKIHNLPGVKEHIANRKK